MSKKRPPVINYNGQRILLETITGYIGIHLDRDSEADQHGVRFHLRNGEIIEYMGNDRECRDKVLNFLDDHFKPISFFANKCQVCADHTPSTSGYCQVRECNAWENYPKFKRKEENESSTKNVHQKQS